MIELLVAVPLVLGAVLLLLAWVITRRDARIADRVDKAQRLIMDTYGSSSFDSIVLYDPVMNTWDAGAPTADNARSWFVMVPMACRIECRDFLNTLSRRGSL